MPLVLCLKWHPLVRCCIRVGILIDRLDPGYYMWRLVNAGIIPVLVELLGSLDAEVQYYSASTLGEFALDGKHTLPSIP